MRRIILLVISLLIVLVSVLYSNHLTAQLAVEEQHRVELWAEATRQFILAEPGDDVDFVSSIIEGNTTIPVYMTDADGKYLFSRNVDLPARLQKEGMEDEAQAWYQKKVDRLRANSTPIEVRISRTQVQYIYYDESKLLRQLHFVPYVQAVFIVVFLIIAVLSLSAAHKAEENRVWVGLCKETAHQLGTPISSLNGWNAVLREQYPDEPAFAEIDNDIQRLATITERFSKIGSRPTLKPAEVLPIVEKTVAYMKTRTSKKVDISIDAGQEEGKAEETQAASDARTAQAASEAETSRAMLAEPLFAWVIENLIRNAVDAMNGQGHIHLKLSTEGKRICLDVSDTGKGIERRKFRSVFQAGYTTKTRGWGLGLSLAKRIIHDYHHGKIYVLNSEIGKGTTFRIELKKI